MKKILFVLLIFTFLACLPFILYPTVLVSRGNDLEEFFWPIIYFSKLQIINNHSIPLWNPLFFSGMPLVSDPQTPVFYFPNIIFLFFNLDFAFILTVFLHIFWASFGIYILSKKIFRFRDRTNLFLSAIYIFSPKLSAYIEAGHLGLVFSYAWLPWTLFIAITLAKKPTLKKSVYLAICLSAIFFTHLLIFFISVIAIFVVYFYTSIKNNVDLRKKIIYLFLALVLNFGFIAIALLPQFQWSSQTTRFLLITNKDVYPKWFGFKEFLKASISPIFFGYKYAWGLDTEKYISIGLGVSIFSLIGLFTLKKFQIVLVTLVILIITLISLNNISPIYGLLQTQSWYSLLRVSTRFWFIVLFLILFLAGLGFEKTYNTKYKIFVEFLAILTCVELLLTSWVKVMKPFNPNYDLVPSQIYEFFKNDKDNFRVLCTTKCLSQKKLAIYNIQSADGYGTLQQKNYYAYSQQLYQAFWRNRYTLAIPPYEIYNYEKFSPYPPSLSALKVKYILSPYEINRNKLTLIKKIDGYFIYKNDLFIDTNYLIYSPNFISVGTNSIHEKSIIISEVYSPGWIALLNGTEIINIQQTPMSQRSVNIKPDTKFVNFLYLPKSFEMGLLITSLTIAMAGSILVFKKNFLISLIVIESFVLRMLSFSHWLEDWDSVQFALGVNHFSVALHQPHPPGYILYIFFGKIINLFFHNPQISLTIFSILSGTLSLFVFYFLAKRILNRKLALIGTLLLSILPLHFILSGAVLTDMPGLFFTIASVYFLYLGKNSNKNLLIGSFLSGITTGIRLGEIPIVLSLLLFVIFIRKDKKVFVKSFLLFALGILLWLIPLILITGPRQLLNLYITHANYIEFHDSFLASGSVLIDRFLQISKSISIGFSKYFLLVIIPIILLLARKKDNSEKFNKFFLVIWFTSYFLILFFIFNLEVTRFIIPIAPPLILLCLLVFKNSRLEKFASIFYVTVSFLVLSTSLPMLEKIITLTPPSIQPVIFVKQNFTPANTTLITTFTYRQFQYYAPEFSNFYGDQNLTAISSKFVIIDYIGLKEHINQLSQYKITSKEEFIGPPEIFSRLSKTNLYVLEKNN